MADPFAAEGNLRDQFLDTGTGSANHADVALRCDVGEGQRGAGDHGGAAVRPHHQQSFVTGAGFEGNFIFQGDVVGEDHHAFLATERLMGQLRGIFSGNGN